MGGFDWLVAAVGWIITVGIEFIPGLKKWWDGMGSMLKWALVVALFLVLPFGVAGLNCIGVSIRPDPACPACEIGAFELLPDAPLIIEEISFQTD